MAALTMDVLFAFQDPPQGAMTRLLYAHHRACAMGEWVADHAYLLECDDVGRDVLVRTDNLRTLLDRATAQSATCERARRGFDEARRVLSMRLTMLQDEAVRVLPEPYAAKADFPSRGKPESRALYLERLFDRAGPQATALHAMLRDMREPLDHATDAYFEAQAVCRGQKGHIAQAAYVLRRTLEHAKHTLLGLLHPDCPLALALRALAVRTRPLTTRYMHPMQDAAPAVPAHARGLPEAATHARGRRAAAAHADRGPRHAVHVAHAARGTAVTATRG